MLDQYPENRLGNSSETYFGLDIRYITKIVKKPLRKGLSNGGITFFDSSSKDDVVLATIKKEGNRIILNANIFGEDGQKNNKRETRFIWEKRGVKNYILIEIDIAPIGNEPKPAQSKPVRLWIMSTADRPVITFLNINNLEPTTKHFSLEYINNQQKDYKEVMLSSPMEGNWLISPITLPFKLPINLPGK